MANLRWVKGNQEESSDLGDVVKWVITASESGVEGVTG